MTALRQTSIAGMILFTLTAIPVLAQLIDPSPFATKAIPHADPFGDLPR